MTYNNKHVFICLCLRGPAGQCLVWLCWALYVSVVSWQVAGWFRMVSLTHLVVSRLSAGVKGGLGHVPLIQQATLSQASAWGRRISKTGEQEPQGFLRPRLGTATPSLPPHSLDGSKSQVQAKLKLWGNRLQIQTEGTTNDRSHFAIHRTCPLLS